MAEEKKKVKSEARGRPKKPLSESGLTSRAASDKKYPRPDKVRRQLTTKLIEEIVAYIEMGNHEEIAASSAGVPLDVYRKWKQKGEQPTSSGMYFKLVFEVDMALARNERFATANIMRAMPTDWRASGWFLERRFSQRWAKILKQEHTGKDGGDITINNVTDQRRMEQGELDRFEAWKKEMGYEDE